MSNDLKRVGLVFTQEGAVDFKKTLQEVNLELNKNYNQFKLTQAQWDKSTTSTQKLREEQEYLKNAYEIQEDKVKTLKMQLSDLENAENKNTTAIKKKRNELTSAEVKLETYNKRIKEIESQLNNTGKKIEEFGTKIENSGKKIESAGKKMSALSTATATALIASAKTAIDFESAFTGVEKTVDGTAEQMEELKQGIRDMAKEIPSSTTEISAVAEAAGQLGIKTENILSFSKAMIDLGNSTNLTASEAASQLAKFANIMNMSQTDFDKLGSSIVDLGNHFATTEADIVDMSMRLAGAGKQVGLSEGQVLGLATALSSVGIEAEMGGSAISKAMVKMQNAVEMGGIKLDDVLKKTKMSLRDLELLSANNSADFKALANDIGMTSTELKQLITAGTNLEDFAKISEMTAEQFQKAWKEDAAGALAEFIKGLGNAEDKGESAITMLSEMGLTEVRLRDSLLRAANAGDLFNNAIETGTKAWEDNTALTNEANKRYDTLKSKITIAVNKLKDMAITLGNKLMPTIEKLVNGFEEWIQKFENLSDEQVDMIVNIGLIVAAIGPLLTIVGKLTSTIGGVTKGIGTVVQAIGAAKGTITSTSTAVNGLTSVFSAIRSPIGLASIALAGITTAAILFNQESRNSIKVIEESSKEIENATNKYNEFAKAQDDIAGNNLAEVSNIQKLTDELKKLVNANGEVKKGYEDRVSFILTELNKGLGTEYEMTGNIINNYNELVGKIDQLITKKRAEIILNNEEAKYNEAISKRTEYYDSMIEKENQLANKKKELADIEKNMNKAQLEGNKELFEYYKKDYDALSLIVDEAQNNFNDSKELYKNCLNDIATYENDFTIIQSGNNEKIQELINQRTYSYQQGSNDIGETINHNIKQIQYEVEQFKLAREEDLKNQDEMNAEKNRTQIEAGNQQILNLANQLAKMTSTTEEMTPQQIEAWKNLANGSFNEYKEVVSQIGPETQKKIQDVTGVIVSDTSMKNSTNAKANEITREFNNNLNFSRKAQDEVNNSAQIFRSDSSIQNEAGNLADRAERAVKSNNSTFWGSDMVQGLGNGIRSKGNSSWFTNILSGLAGKIASYLHFSKPDVGPLKEYEKWMPDMVEGLGKTLDKSSPRLINSVKNMTGEMSNELQSIQYGLQGNTNINGNSNTKFEMDYNKMANAITKALTNCKFTLEEDGFVKIVKEELYKVV